MEQKTKNKRGVDTSPYFPGEKEMIEEARKKIYAIRAKREAEKRKQTTEK